MASRAKIISRTKLEMAELTRALYQEFPPEAGVELDLERDSIVPGSEVVWTETTDGTQTMLVRDTDYTINNSSGQVILNDEVTGDVKIVVSAETNRLFSDEEYGTFVDTAFEMHTNNRSVSMAGLPSKEEYLVALLAKYQALWVLVTDSAYEIDIHQPEGATVPRTQRFAQLMALLQATKEQYQEFANALGVGIWRIEMFTLRRVSRLTNRYIPVYLPREIDDNRPPQRVYPNVDSQHEELVSPKRGVVPLTIVARPLRPFTRKLDFTESDGTPADLTGYIFKASIHENVFTGSVKETFVVDATNAAAGVLHISLTEAQVDNLRLDHRYAWSLTWTPPNGEPDVVLYGPVSAVSEEVAAR